MGDGIDYCYFCGEELHWYADESPGPYFPGCGEEVWICGAHVLLVKDEHWEQLKEQWSDRDWDLLSRSEKNHRLGWS